MTPSRSSIHPFILVSMLVAVGCATPGAGARSSHAAWTVPPDGHADALFRVRPAAVPVALPAGSATAAHGGGIARMAEAKLVAPIAVADTFVPGAVLDVWLNDRGIDLQTLTSGPSLGQAVVQGDYFRYSSVLSAANLRGSWGQPLVLKWSAYLQITKDGDHVFVSELAERQRTDGALWVRTLVKLNGETLFEESAHLLLSHNLQESSMRSLRLRPGQYRLEVWLAVYSTKAPSPQLGTYLSMREPGLASAVPIEAWRITHLR